MAKTKEQKAAIIEKLHDAFKRAFGTVFVHFKGLSVSEEGEMRSKMKEEGVRYYVAKKKLISRALEGSGVEGELPALEGEIAIAYDIGGEGTDPTVSARAVHAFYKKFGQEKLSIVGGIFERSFKDAQSMNEIASIPPVEVLRGMFVNVINSPIQRMAIALGQIAKKKA